MAFGGQTSDKNKLMMELKKDQGPFENEIYFEDGDIIGAVSKCEKNPGHEGFYSVKDFSTNDLPEGFKNEKIVEAVTTLSDLTALVKLKKISEGRPQKFPDTDDDYPYYKNRGLSIGRVGTAWVVRVKGKYPESRGKVCRCVQCMLKPEEDRCKNFGKVIIWTAKHLIYDGTEGKSCEIKIFFEDEQNSPNFMASSGNGESVCQLYPKRYWHSDITGDWCGLKCVVHDLEMWDKLKEKYNRFETLQREVDTEYKSSEERLAIIVAHPHGSQKRITVGTWHHRDDLSYHDDTVQTIYTYDTKTCDGCSGAPVWVLGRKIRGLFTSHPHSRVDDAKLKTNRSAVGFDW